MSCWKWLNLMHMQSFRDCFLFLLLHVASAGLKTPSFLSGWKQPVEVRRLLWFSEAAADTQCAGPLTDAYLTLHIFEVLYFYMTYGNRNLSTHSWKSFLHFFLFVSALVCFVWAFFFSFFFYNGNHFGILQFSLFSTMFVKFQVSWVIFLQWCMLYYGK